jgi:NAD(P)-dependent dehydrogenase (short-subunit alcohol dehydrogenase family)
VSNNWTETDIPDQTGKIVLITGANSGIGFEAARALAQHGATVVLGCRNRGKADEAVTKIAATNPSGTTEILEMDLADLESVEKAANLFLADHEKLDLLINNAGLMATPPGRTAQGFEMQFGVNHLGHFAFTGHLLPLILTSGPARIVSISSQGHRPGRIDFDDLNWETRTYSPWRAYFQTKLANLLFIRELQRRLVAAEAEAIAVAAHPGSSNTNLGHENPGGFFNTLMHASRPFLEKLMTQSAEMGALPTLRVATQPDVQGGDYYGPNGLGQQRGHPVKVGMSNRAQDDQTARRLWDVSGELTGVTYPI